MTENKWEIDGHHYTCPACKKTMAIVVNESDEGLEFCPFCGERISSQMAEHNFDKLLGRNGELVEVRKKQVLAGALEIVQRYCDETPNKNKMKVIAQLFGKKLGEKFCVSVPQYDVYGEIKDTVLVRGWFNSRGFRSEQIAIADSYIFAELLEGGAVIDDD